MVLSQLLKNRPANGLNVAAIAGLPLNAITRAKEVLNALHVQDNKKSQHQLKEETVQPNLFQQKTDTSLLKIKTELDKLDVDNLSPKKALNKLYSLKEIT